MDWLVVSKNWITSARFGEALLYADVRARYRFEDSSKHEHYNNISDNSDTGSNNEAIQHTTTATPLPSDPTTYPPHQPTNRHTQQVAASIDPSNASCALGLVHGHEIRGDYAKALAAAKSFLAGNPEGGVGARGVKNRCGLEPAMLRS